MSTSAIWVLDEEYKGVKIKNYKNAFLISPVIWDFLFKHYGFKGFVFSNADMKSLDTALKSSKKLEHRILWEFSMQGVFNMKDRDKVVNALEYIISTFNLIKEDEHIKKLFELLVVDLKQLNSLSFNYFVYEASSPNIEIKLFKDELGNNQSLKNNKNYVCDFIKIDEDVLTYISNIAYINAN